MTNILATIAVCLTTNVWAAEMVYTDAATNYLTTPEQYAAEWRRRTELPDVLKLLAASGDVCTALGHAWESGCGKDGCAVWHKAHMRTCRICRKTQTQQPTEWR